MVPMDDLFQFITEVFITDEKLEMKFDELPCGPGHVRWVRASDGSNCSTPDRRIIKVLLGLQLMDSSGVSTKDGNDITRYHFTDKARRMLTARAAKSSALETVNTAEYCWLVVHENRGLKEVYPYLGVEPPDIGALLEPGWSPTPNIDTFQVRCLPFNVYLRNSELFLESTAVRSASASSQL